MDRPEERIAAHVIGRAGAIDRAPVAQRSLADVRRFAVEEKRCCAFWGFAVETGAGLTLQWDAPPDATELVDGLEAFFTGDGPLSDALAGLL